jgi:hypothetical protein
MNKKHWHQTFVKGIGINLWAAEWDDQSILAFDADVLAEQVSRTGSELAFTFQGFTQDQLGKSFFPTRKGPVHRNLAPGRDHMGEYLDALRKRGIRAFGYYSFPDRTVWERNPDWRMIDSEGRDIHYSITGELCPNTPYRDYMIDRVREVAARYELDGILIDAARFMDACYCDSCRRKYRDRFGSDLPVAPRAGDPEWVRFNEWRYDCVTELLRDIHATVKDANQNTLFTHNWFPIMWGRLDWQKGEDFEATAELDDVVTALSKWTQGDARFTDMIWQNGFMTKYCRGLSGDKPVWIQMGRFPYGRDYQVLPVHELKLAAYSVAIAGGSPIFIDNAFPDGTPDIVGFDALTDAYHDVAAGQNAFDCREDLSQVAIYYSRRSDDVFDFAFPGEKRHANAVQGAYKALVEGHIPALLVGEQSLEDSLSQASVLVVPAAPAMGDYQVRSIRKFVEQGGTLIASGRTSLLNMDGTPRHDFGLRDVFAAEYVNPIAYESSFVLPTEHWLFEGVDGRKHLLQRCEVSKVVPLKDAECAGMVQLPITAVDTGVRGYIDEQAVSHGQVTRYPAAIVHQLGKGRCIYFAADVTRDYGLYGNPDLRTIFLNAVAAGLGSQRLVQVEAPSCVEVGLFRGEAMYCVHLLNYAHSSLRLSRNVGGACATEGVPVHEIRIRLRVPDAKNIRVYLASTEHDLPAQLSDGFVEVVVDRLDVFESVVFEVG